MVARVNTVAPIGFEGSLIEVECDTSKSLPSLQIVGLGNKAIDEARERVKSAIVNSFLEFPKKRVTINLAPAELPKDGAHYDLPIALSILCVSGQIRQDELSNAIFAGELALNGDIRPIKGAINVVEYAKKSGYKKVFIPYNNIPQASLINGIEIIGVKSLKQLFLHLKNEIIINNGVALQINSNHTDNTGAYAPYLDDIRGQHHAKHALIIAAAGHHNLIMSGTPGSGKTMLAKTLSSLLPELNPTECIAATKIHSIAGRISNEIVNSRPFRSPHHTASHISIIGGGNNPKPGEISLAHTGVLFLDELLEYPRSTIESLRQPLEDKKIDISRANAHISYPADFMLVATMNPCPCGYLGDKQKECICTPIQISQYQKKLSGPLLDRIDLGVKVSKVSNEDLLKPNKLSKKHHMHAKKCINNAITAQNNRYGSSHIYNSSLSNRDIEKHIVLSEEVLKLLSHATNKLNLTARSYYKLIKVARTIADLENEKDINIKHISEAMQYRW